MSEGYSWQSKRLRTHSPDPAIEEATQGDQEATQKASEDSVASPILDPLKIETPELEDVDAVMLDSEGSESSDDGTETESSDEATSSADDEDDDEGSEEETAGAGLLGFFNPGFRKQLQEDAEAKATPAEDDQSNDHATVDVEKSQVEAGLIDHENPVANISTSDEPSRRDSPETSASVQPSSPESMSSFEPTAERGSSPLKENQEEEIRQYYQARARCRTRANRSSPSSALHFPSGYLKASSFHM